MALKASSQKQVMHKMLRVLVADDSAISRDVIKRGIQVHSGRRYLDVNFAKDGAAAMRILQEKQIDMAFIDIHMPGMTGPQLVSQLRNTKSSNCLTVIVSSQMSVANEAMLKEFGAYHFMEKPFRANDVADAFLTYIVMTENYKILVVDDSATMRTITRKILNKSLFSFDIYEAASAEEAMKALVTHRPTLVLTDFHMPDIDGLELAGAIRSVSDKIGLYMMSTSDTDYLERSAAFVGITGFLKKPFNSEDIDSIMHQRLGLDTPKFGSTRAMFKFLERPMDDGDQVLL